MTSRKALNRGLIAGIVMSFVGGIGMVTVFNGKTLIEPYLTLGYAMLFAIPLAVALISTKREVLEGIEVEPPDARDVAQGSIIGLVGGLLTAFFILLIDTVDVSDTFPNMSLPTIREMTFDMDLFAGLSLLVAASLVAGTVGGAFRLLPDRWGHAITRGVLWVIAISFLEIVVEDVFGFFKPFTRFIYALNGGLNPSAAVLIFLLPGALAYRFRGTSTTIRSRFMREDSQGRSVPTGLAFILIAVGVVVLPMVLGGLVNELLINVALFMLMGLGLNIVVGLAGLLDLGYVAFFAVGAYTSAVLTASLSPTWNPELGWWVALGVTIVFAVIAGLLVGTPVIRMRGDYLAIVTLGFGEIVRILLLSDWLKPYFGGAQGIRGIPGISFFGTTTSGVDPERFVYFAAFFVAIAVYISWRLLNSRIGRAWAALREDEDVAEAIGVNTVRAKLLAFVIGAVLASFAGALVSAKVGTVFTNSFDVLVSIIILMVVIVGGMGSIPGVMAGALVMIGVLGGPRSPGLLAELSQFKILIYAVILVVMMLKRPEGLIPSARRSRELHHEELSQDDWLDKGGRLTSEETEEVPA